MKRFRRHIKDKSETQSVSYNCHVLLSSKRDRANAMSRAIVFDKLRLIQTPRVKGRIQFMQLFLYLHCKKSCARLHMFNLFGVKKKFKLNWSLNHFYLKGHDEIHDWIQTHLKMSFFNEHVFESFFFVFWYWVAKITYVSGPWMQVACFFTFDVFIHWHIYLYSTFPNVFECYKFIKIAGNGKQKIILLYLIAEQKLKSVFVRIN